MSLFFTFVGHLNKRKLNQLHSLQTYFASLGKRGNVILAVIPPSLDFEENEGEDGDSLDQFTSVKQVRV